MTPPIEVKIYERIVTLVSKPDKVVSGTTYSLVVTEWDDEWADEGATVWNTTYTRVWFMGQYYDFPFNTPSGIPVTIPTGVGSVDIGFYRGELNTSNAIRLDVTPSILDREGNVYAEFTGEMYDAWLEETSELLCDDSFDGESPRPVKNSVLTAWKNTVPLDSALVHKTGSESIDGTKTFNAGLFAGGTTPLLHLRSTGASTSPAWRGVIRISDKNGSADSDIVEARIVSGGTGSSNSLEVYGAKPDRSSKMLLLNGRAYADHCALLTTPYYPVDGSSNPQALTANALVASGNIAVDPRIVHTTGTETIAGAKTFISPIEVNATQGNVILHSTNATGWFSQIQVKDSTNALISAIISSKETAGFNRLNLRTYVSGGTSSQYGQLMIDRYADHTLVSTDPYYPVDGSSNPQPLTASALMTSGNVAVDPRIVHTTGNETVAGVKTFTSAINFDAKLVIKNAVIANDNHWFRLYEIAPHNNSGNVEFIVRKRTGAYLPSRFQLYCGGAGSDTLSFQVETNPSLVQCVAARRASDNHVEIWGKGIWTDWQIPFYYRHGMAVSDYQTADEPPAVGDTYNLIATI